MNPRDAPLAELYQALVLEHGRKPRHAALPVHADARAERDNPYCGDRVTLGIRIEAGTIVEVGFEADGCVISLAAASLLCEAVHGTTPAAARVLCARYLELIAARAETWPADLGALRAFARVAMFPARSACASLACGALHEALSVLARNAG